MTGQQKNVPQSVRLLYLVLYLAFLFAMNRLAFGQWLPLPTSKGLWFYSGAAALILGSLLGHPRKKPVVDTRTPEELLNLIDVNGWKIAAVQSWLTGKMPC